MSLIIVSILGTSGIRTSYRLNSEQPVITTSHFPEALAQWFPEAESLILATELAADSDNGKSMKKCMGKNCFITIPNGSNEGQGWEIFETLSQKIPKDSQVILDMTHGFRSLPMLTFLSLSYLRIVKNIELKAIYYAAFDAKDNEGVAPVFDLTPFVNLIDWAQAAEQFLRTGDARPMTALISNPDMESLQQLKEPLESISASLAFQRPIQTARNAQLLRKRIEKIKKQKLKHPVMGLMLDHIEDRFSGIAHGDGAFKDRHEQVIRGQYSQIKFYVRGGQYAQAMELAYEWMRSLQMWKLGRPQEQGLWLDAKRLKAEAMGRTDFKPTELWNEFFRVQEQVRLLRNSFAHFTEYKREFGEELADPNTLAHQVETIILTLLPAAVRPLGLELEPSTPAEAGA